MNYFTLMNDTIDNYEQSLIKSSQKPDLSGCIKHMLIVLEKFVYMKQTGLFYCFRYAVEAYQAYGSLKFVQFEKTALMSKKEVSENPNGIYFTEADLLETINENMANLLLHVVEAEKKELKLVVKKEEEKFIYNSFILDLNGDLYE